MKRNNNNNNNNVSPFQWNTTNNTNKINTSSLNNTNNNNNINNANNNPFSWGNTNNNNVNNTNNNISTTNNTKNGLSMNNNEYNFGVPVSKSMPFNFNHQPHSTEYAQGIPMSKSGGPIHHPFNAYNFGTSASKSVQAPNTAIFNSSPQTWSNHEYAQGIPMSKSGRPIAPSTGYNFGAPASKSVPLNHINSNISTGMFNNEYSRGIPMSKSGRPMMMNTSAPQMPSLSQQFKDLNTSPSVSPFTQLTTSNVNKNNVNVMKQREYSRGIPMSKSGRPLRMNNMSAHKAPVVNPASISYHTVVSIEDILRRDVNALLTLKRCLVARGWCKIKYPQRTTKVINSVMAKIHQWFIQTDANEKLKYSRKLTDGSNKANPQSEYSYNRIDGFKEGLRILTGDIYKIHYKNDKYPDDVKDDIMKINKEFDDLSVEIMQSVYDFVYGLADYKQFGTAFDISILNQDKPKYSMLDFVNYYNDKQYIHDIRSNKGKVDDTTPTVLKSEFNVFSHSDPGLFALSFASTNEGLEMYDNLSQKWIKIGLNEGIWWNGKTSNIIDSSMKSGQHRIKIDNINWKPRFTGWYEVSCNKQLKDEIMNEAINMRQNVGKSILDDHHNTKQSKKGVPSSKNNHAQNNAFSWSNHSNHNNNNMFNWSTKPNLNSNTNVNTNNSWNFGVSSTSNNTNNNNNANHHQNNNVNNTKNNNNNNASWNW